MADQLFVITGGGTGAKVAEALTHVCAAGVAPDEVHVLLIDSDASNGNVQRAVRAADSYSSLQSYPWSVQDDGTDSWMGSNGATAEGVNLFDSRLHLYRLTQPLSTVLDGGLQTSVGDDQDISQVLKLLYDEDERHATCEDGFRARPNIGCLLLSEHLNEELVRNQEAQEFLDRMANAASTQPVVPVAVTASVFGGTGASLLPVIRGCIEEAFRRSPDSMVNTDKLHWNAVKILPHCEPKSREKSIDPDRFLLDTATTLQFYSKVYRGGGDDAYDGVYLVGSDQPARNRMKVELGSQQQSNPGFFEELLAALAIIDAAERAGERREQIRVYEPDENQQYLNWEDLPVGGDGKLRNGFAHLLHLASFHLQRGGSADLTKGFAELVHTTSPSHLRQFAWYKNVIDPWAEHAQIYESASAKERPRKIREDSALGDLTFKAMADEAAEYFGRLLLWTETALKGENLALVDYRDGDYVSVHYGMSMLDEGDAEATQGGDTLESVQADEDNALIRGLRAAHVAMHRFHSGDFQLDLPVENFQLVNGRDMIPLAITTTDIEESLQSHQLQGIVDEFTRTRVTNGAS